MILLIVKKIYGNFVVGLQLICQQCVYMVNTMKLKCYNAIGE